MNTPARDTDIPGFAKTLDTMYALMQKKNADYCGAAGKNDAFINFKRVEAMGITTTEKGLLTRMSDKLGRAGALIDTPAKVKDEALEDTLIDLANYAIILKCYFDEKKKAATATIDAKTTTNKRPHTFHAGDIDDND